MVNNNENVYDVVIIGGGSAGFPGSVYAARYDLKTLVIVKETGGLITTTDKVHNFPAINEITGYELGMKFEEQAVHNGVEIVNDIVYNVERLDNGDFRVKTEYQELEFIAKSLIVATGSKHRHLNIPGEEEFKGRGVSFCATCDGGFYKDKVIGIVGGGDSAVREAIILANLGRKVYMFVRNQLRAEPVNIKQLESLDNVEIIYGVNLTEIKGDEFMSSVVMDVEYNGSSEIAIDGLFIAVGLLPQNEIPKSLGCELNSAGEVIIDRESKTNVAGVFAAGDVTDVAWKQSITAAAAGGFAAYSAFNYLQSKKEN